MVRRKSTTQNAPSTLSEAISTIEAYLSMAGAIEIAKADADAAILRIQAARDELIAPAKAGLDDLFLQLRAWWSVAGPEMTKGKTKSVELAGGLIGERTTTPSLKSPRGVKADEAVALIQEIVEKFPGAAELLRIKTELDKPAMIKLLRGTTVGPVIDEVKAKGFKVSQRDEFFVDRATAKEPDPETIDAPAPVIAEARS